MPWFSVGAILDSRLSEAAGVRICFLNPFGTPSFDDIVGEVLQGALRPDAELEVRHLDAGPRNIDYYAPKQLVQVEVLRAGLKIQREGFDALVIGCCYDPALTEARELLDIPVIGPLETAAGLARMFGHRYAVVTDHPKAVPELYDRLRIYGAEANLAAVEAVGWFVDDMVLDPASVGRDAQAQATRVLERTHAETVIIGCTIVSACYERSISRGEIDDTGASIIDPNILAVKAAEMFADLHSKGQYRISRDHYYQRLDAHDPVEAAEVARFFNSELPAAS